MIRPMRAAIVGAILLGGAACDSPHQAPQPTPAVKPVARYDRSDFLRSIYQAKLATQKGDNAKAALHIHEAQMMRPFFGNKKYGTSDLLMGITYLHHGTLSELYVPSLRDEDKRYLEASAVLAEMKLQALVPLGYRLVTFSPNPATDLLDFRLDRAEKALASTQSDDVTEAFILANNELDQLLKLINARIYNGDATIRLDVHTHACELFLHQGYYDLARIAHTNAVKALGEVSHQPANATMAESYKTQLAKLMRAIDHRDPSLIDKIGKTFNSIL